MKRELISIGLVIGLILVIGCVLNGALLPEEVEEPQYEIVFHDRFDGFAVSPGGWNWSMSGKWSVNQEQQFLQTEDDGRQARLNCLLERDGTVIMARIRMDGLTASTRNLIRLNEYLLSFASQTAGNNQGLLLRVAEGSNLYWDQQYSVPLGQWFEVKFTFTEDEIYLYIDDEPVFTVEDTTVREFSYVEFYNWSDGQYDVDELTIERLVKDDEQEDYEMVAPGHGNIAPLTLPTIDISHDTERHVMIAEGTDVYHGHPNTVLMEDGHTMFCVWSLNHLYGATNLKRSNDAGLSWEAVANPPTNWDQGRLPLIHRLTDPDGQERLFIFDAAPGENKGGAMLQSVSEDGGLSWSPMAPNGLDWMLEPPMNIIPSQAGEKLMMWHSGPGIKQAESYDGGLTWVNEQHDIIRVPGTWLIEPGVVRSPDGEQLLMLARAAFPYNSVYSVSDDDGKTWSRPKRLPAGLTGDRHAIQYAPDGRLVVVFRDALYNGTSPSLHHFIAWVGEYEDIIEGRDGQYRVKLLHNYPRGAGDVWPQDCGYAGLEVLPDGTFVATTYVKYREDIQQSVVSTRFHLDQLDNMLAANQSMLAPLAGPSKNEAGAPLLTEPRAVMEPVSGEVQTLNNGATIFADRSYPFDTLPQELEGKSFIQSSIQHTKAVCQEAGVVYVLTLRPEGNIRGSLAEELLAAGFEKTNLSDFVLSAFSREHISYEGIIGSVYQKQVEVGDMIEFGFLGVLVF